MMTEKPPMEESEESADFPYLGNSIPKILRWVYAVFIVWAVGYLALYGWPDLMDWLQRLNP